MFSIGTVVHAMIKSCLVVCFLIGVSVVSCIDDFSGFQSRIINGTDADILEFPYMVKHDKKKTRSLVLKSQFVDIIAIPERAWLWWDNFK